MRAAWHRRGHLLNAVWLALYARQGNGAQRLRPCSGTLAWRGIWRWGVFVQGISHITFVVRDLDRMAAFLCDGLGAQEVYDSAGHNYSLSREKFFLLGGVWLAAMEGAPPAERSYQHVAFQVAEPELELYRQRLEALGAEVRPPRARVEGEGQSLYVYDFDNHLFELHTGTLAQRLARYAQP
jgi:catechol 2,3-dioxygenase-like lactoylglutathione lyase family enzyme